MLTVKSRAEAESLLAELRTYSNHLAAARAEKESLIAEHQRRLVIPDTLEAEIAALELTLAEAQLALGQWAEANRESEFNGGQSLELEHGYLRFRKGKRGIALLEGWTWPKVVHSMKRSWKKYVRMTPSVNKELLLEATAYPARASSGKTIGPELEPQKLKQVGMVVVQEESFTVELKALAAQTMVTSV